jgi:hypothetical protein
MAKEQSLVCVSAPAGADLSAKQFHIVKIDTSTGKAVLGAAKTDEVAGICRTHPRRTRRRPSPFSAARSA